MDKTATDTDDFDFDPEEFARVMREVGFEFTKLQEQIAKSMMEFGNAWNRIVTPQFREMVELAGDKKHRPIPVKGARPELIIIDELPLFETPEDKDQ